MPTDTASFGFQDVPKAEKAARVRGVFSSVASKYDLMNDAMSGGMHRLWKDAAAAKLNPQPGELILDVAGGTGDIARRLKKLGDAAAKRRGLEPPEIHVIDINAEMLEAGRKRGEDGLYWHEGDAERLPVDDGAADAYIISFGIRNCTDIPAVLREAKRVLKPGGRFYCLEFSRLAIGGLEPVYDFYSFKAIPALGKLLADDPDSYRYLVESIRRFPDQERFLAMIGAAGFARAAYRNMAGGVVALHWGWSL
ncbi:MAG TPA: bifunctional demethylmenaquinone methyltransferase/2-methoxy-6-polyprenyl-1,4-benzoquinol methylase [Hyphomonadaceae bacterium]|nr:bifunctional demethylmenaquinone methyltransferase/2-methoxy-6-polyprenyl-1,4-benzoquinol methylase [Hyphomonadaceae bacterium]